ncbi:transmembrane protein 163a-like [Oscarella lobularis]|uniref:transmembrane protein 163a-like n=1 Tax=Oscarella lobularis TaxID=121494 RepID=UPI003313564E
MSTSDSSSGKTKLLMATYAYEIQRTDVHAGIDSIDSIDSSPFAYQCISAIDDQLTLGREHKLTPHVVRRWRSFALMLAWMSIVVNFAMAVVAFVFAFVANSPASFGFAFNAALDSLTSILVLWRFWGRDGAKFSWKREWRATIAIAVLFVFSSLGISARAIVALCTEQKPDDAMAIIIMSSIMLFMSAAMAWGKYVAGVGMHSTVLKIDALNSGLGALMGLGVVISSVVYTFVDSVWYLDSIVGLLIALVLFSTGVRMLIKLLSRRGRLSPPQE